MKNLCRSFGVFYLMVLVALVFVPAQNQNLLSQQWRGIYNRIDGPIFKSPVTATSSPIVQLAYVRSHMVLKATGEIDEKLTTTRMQEIVRRYPNDAAALAYYLRSEQRMNRPLYDNGPLTSTNLAWSVAVNNYAPTPPNVTTSSNNFPADFGKVRQSGVFNTVQEYEAILELIRHGQKLEPQNTYFDWMLILALLQADRGEEATQVVEKAWNKTDFNDHTTEEFLAMADYQRQRGLETEIKYSNLSATSLPHLGRMRSATRYLAQHTMALRMHKRDVEALEWGRKCLRFSQIVRLKGGFLITSYAGKGMEQVILCQTHLPLQKIPFKRDGEKPVLASQLTAHPYSLSHLAQQLNRSQAVAELEKEWDVLEKWRVKELQDFDGLVSEKTYLPLGLIQRATRYCIMALTLSSIFWILISSASHLKFLPKLQEKPRTIRFLAGGGLATLLVIAGNVGFEWFVIASNPAGFCGFGYSPSEILFPSIVSMAGYGNWRLGIGAMPLLFIWFALLTSGAIKWNIRPRPSNSNLNYDDLAGHRIHYSTFIHFLDRTVGLSKALVFFCLRWFAPIGILAGFISALALIPVNFQNENGLERTTLNYICHFGLLFVILILIPIMLILGRVLIQRRPKREDFQIIPAFLWRTQALLSGLILMTLLLLAILLPIQAEGTRKFDGLFSIYENRQTIQTLQARELLPKG